MNIKQEDLIRFWNWVGLNFKYSRAPELELDLIYRYAIPKLQKEGLAVTLIAYAGSRFNARIIVSSFRNLQELANESADSPTEALYNAILKVIENETNKS